MSVLEHAKEALLPAASTINAVSPTRVWALRGPRQMVILAAAAISAVLLLWHAHVHSPYQTWYSRSMNDIHNRTLGFQRAFVVSLPARTDRQDSFLASSAFAGFDVDFINGVLTEDVSAKATPWNWDPKVVGKGVLGSWRAHMNVLDKIVKERIQTALIFEDDADYDPALKQQLSMFAEGMRELLPPNSAHCLQTPYGQGWDMLWLGHIRLGPANNETDFYVIEGDKTSPPLSDRYGRWYNIAHEPEVARQEETRLVFRASNGGIGITAYALTYEAARKALVELSIMPRKTPLDVSIRDFCKGQYGIQFNCYGVWPTLVGMHTAAGPADRGSDNDDWPSKVTKEHTIGVGYSTAANLHRLATGDQFVEGQWRAGNGEKELRLIDEPVLGRGELRKIDLSQEAPPAHAKKVGQ